MNHPSTRGFLPAVLCALLIAPAEAAESVEGKFVLDDKVLAPTAVAAFRARDQSNPREHTTYVMLSTQPMDLDAITASANPYLAAINDKAVLSSDHLTFRVDADGTVGMNAHVGGTQYIDTSGKMMGMSGALTSECRVNTPERVSCNVANAKPVKSMSGNSWTVDIKFDTAVVSRAPGKPLPKDGGEPGKVLDALIGAVKGDDLGAIIALLSPEEAEDYQREYSTPAENLASAKEMLDFSLPKDHRITGGELSDDNTALLEVEGAPYEGARGLYIVTLERTDGRWGYRSSTLAGLLE